MHKIILITILAGAISLVSGCMATYNSSYLKQGDGIYSVTSVKLDTEGE